MPCVCCNVHLFYNWFFFILLFFNGDGLFTPLPFLVVLITTNLGFLARCFSRSSLVRSSYSSSSSSSICYISPSLDESSFLATSIFCFPFQDPKFNSFLVVGSKFFKMYQTFVTMSPLFVFPSFFYNVNTHL